MDEVRRFIRYTLPGIACALQLGLALVISDPSTITENVTLTSGGEGIALVLGALVASGGVGYLFAVFYFSLYWWNPIAKRLAIDHATLFSKLKGKLEIRDINNESIEIDSLTKRDAWRITVIHWYSRIKADQTIENIDTTKDRLVDVTHSLGATVVGSILTFISWLIVYLIILSHSLSLAVCLTIFLWSGTLILIISNYLRILRSLQSIINTVLMDTILKEYESSKKPVIIRYSN